MIKIVIGLLNKAELEALGQAEPPAGAGSQGQLCVCCSVLSAGTPGMKFPVHRANLRPSLDGLQPAPLSLGVSCNRSM